MQFAWSRIYRYRHDASILPVDNYVAPETIVWPSLVSKAPALGIWAGRGTPRVRNQPNWISTKKLRDKEQDVRCLHAS